MSALRILLVPLSIVYSIIMYVRNKLFDSGIFKSYKISKPVISIGNITAGGTGKTPLTIFISEYFLSKGKTVGIVSRGYGRKSGDVVIVCDGNKINDNTEQSGDELVLISDELMKNYKNKFFTAAGGDRIEASNLLIRQFNPDIIILDDAFQHRKIARDLDAVIIDAGEFAVNKFLNFLTIPSGRLREGVSNLQRADIIIQNNKASEISAISELKDFGKEVVEIRYITEYYMDFKNSILHDLQSDAVVFSGIADDSSFIKMVRASGMKIAEAVKFSDHHNFNIADIKLLMGKISDKCIFITTEKDFVKVRQFNEFVSEYPVYYLKLGIEISKNGNALYKKLDEFIK